MKPSILLVCSKQITFPLTAGFGIRIINTARTLMRRYEVDLLFLDESPIAPEAMQALEGVFRRVIRFAYPPARFATHALFGLCSTKPLQVHYYTFGAIRRWIETHQHRYTAVFGCHARVAEMLKGLKVPVALDLVDAISLNYERAMTKASAPARWVYGLERSRLLRYEVAAVNYFGRSFVVSDIDRTYLIEHGADPARLVTTPVTVQPHVMARTPSALPEEDAVVFLGKMSYAPNKDAVLTFAEQVFPALRARVPGCTFYVVGTEPPKEIRALGEIPGIEVTGFVADPYPYLERAKVVVAPVRFGAGLQNKVLEGMALRKAVVASTLATEGIGGRSGRDYLVADEPQEMVDAIAHCFEDAALRQQLGTHARRLIETTFTSEAVSERLLDEMNRLPMASNAVWTPRLAF